jgi:hypothetical protein
MLSSYGGYGLPDDNGVEESSGARFARRIRESEHLPRPFIVEGLLSEDERAAIFAFGEEAGRSRTDGTSHDTGARVEWFSTDGGALCYGDLEHTAKMLHASGGMKDGVSRTFGEAHPELLDKLVSTMRNEADAAGMCPANTLLNIRCIELHNYLAGAGLDDLGHIDVGSTLTLSIQLSAPGDRPECGGQFATIDASGPTIHPLGIGDGILFHSQMVHNVSKIRQGVRNSLVIEVSERKRVAHPLLAAHPRCVLTTDCRTL